MTERMTPVVFSVHAVARYIERARPGLDEDLARLELMARAQFARITEEAPDWLRGNPRNADAFLLLDDAVFVLQRCRRRLVATTCVVHEHVYACPRVVVHS